MTKYDWSNVPKEVNWIATDSDGVCNGFINEPCKHNSHMMWFDGDDFDPIPDMYGLFKGNWQDSLEERPTETDLPETVVKSLGEVA